MSSWNWSGRGKTSKPAIWSDPKVVAEAKEVGLEDDEIEDGGGWRKDETKRSHWLRLRQLVEFTKQDLSIKSDADFWTWFASYRKTENISGGRGPVNFNSYSSGYASKAKDYLTDWWTGWGYGGASADERKLAVGLSATKTTIGVINNSGKRYNVKFSDDGSNATDLDERNIVVSPEALLDKKLEDAVAIRVTTGWGLHEASHAEYTPEVADQLQTPVPLEPFQISGLLLNLLEDLRIERLTAEKFPGFATYFEESNRYLWDKQAPTAPTVWGPDLKTKLGAVILATKWSDDYESMARGDAALSAEFDWWKAWGETYRIAEDTSGARQLVIDGLNRLREDPDTAKKLDHMALAEAKMRSDMAMSPGTLSADEFSQLMEQLRKQGPKGGPAGFDPCPSPERSQGRPIQLDAAQSEEVRKLVNEQLEIKFSQFPDAATGAAPQFVITKPLEDAESRMRYEVPNRSLVARIKAAFFFRKRIPAHDDRMLKKGEIDDEQLWRVGVEDYRVFFRRHMEEQDFIAATMLIDVSGSMHGENVRRAQMLATVLMECFATMPNARVKVRAHTHLGNDDCTIYRIWEPGDARTRLGLLATVQGGSNYDGYAIEYCANEMVKDARPNETKLLIVLSDGRPNGGRQYRGTPAMKHVRWVTDHFGRKDIAIFQIAVDEGVDARDQATMFANWIPFDAQKMPQLLGRLLIRLFGASQ